ncbi:MAG: hypothetical protein ACLGHL_07235 [Actinomycetota bacterium]
MADKTGGGVAGDPIDERVEALAHKLLRNASENGLDPGDLAGARRMAFRSLEDSEARTLDPATMDPESDEVIRRTSGETSSIGDTVVRRSSGE